MSCLVKSYQVSSSLFKSFQVLSEVETRQLWRYNSQLQLSYNPKCPCVCPSVRPSAKLSYFPSLDFLDFLHKNSTKIEKKSDRARFSKKNLILAKKKFLGSKWLKIKVFATLRENASLDFAHFAYLDRSHQYLQLFYWHQVLENSFRP